MNDFAKWDAQQLHLFNLTKPPSHLPGCPGILAGQIQDTPNASPSSPTSGWSALCFLPHSSQHSLLYSQKRLIINIKPPAPVLLTLPIQNANATSGESGGAGGNWNDFPLLNSHLSSSGADRTSNLNTSAYLPQTPLKMHQTNVTSHSTLRLNRATYGQGGSTNPIIEPTPALYRPIKGGGYVVTRLKVFARRVGADVVMQGCVQLGVGSVGRFGSGASSLVSVCFYRSYALDSAASVPQLPDRRPFRGLLDWLQTKTPVSFTWTHSPPPIRRFTSQITINQAGGQSTTGPLSQKPSRFLTS